MQTMSRPIHWLGPDLHSVDHYISLGRQSLQAGLNHRALNWGTSSAPDVDFYNTCRPNCFLWPELALSSALPWAPLLRPLNHLCELDPSSRPVALMTAIDLSNWWSMLIKPVSYSDVEFQFNLSRPEFLVRVGYCGLALNYFSVSEEISELAACLSMVGVGAIEILLASTCDLCRLRRAAPGLKRCDQCSRSKQLFDAEASGSRAAKSLRTKRIRDRIGISMVSTSEDLHVSFSRAMASLLFTMKRESAPHQRWLEGVHSSLDIAPMVREKLPSNFTEIEHTAQLAALREAIDRNEWDYGVWPSKILKAQAFFEASKVVDDRRRADGILPRTIELGDRARALLRQGLSKTEVASRLSISRSHLSHVLGRTSGLHER